ncbi:MAG: phosphomannomutase/phosphoglucomutase [Aigarchaeota archaeon]|nr:phosphomannomutase/phosphoglucomutase [Candidatus Pelearchaeum maunauluense]
MSIADHIFRAYDIRGVYGEDLNDDIAYRVGRALGTFIGGRGSILVTRDVRRSGEALCRALIDGLRESGIDVIFGGITTTPAAYFGLKRYNADAAVAVTASHNPPEWNGFKMVLKDGTTISQGAGMEKLREIIKNASFIRSDKRGSLREVKLVDDYIEFMRSRFRRMDGLKVAVDYSDGSAVYIVPRLFAELGMRVIGINDNPDGFFRGHVPEPNEETLKPLQRIVVENGCDLGVGFDGDADRAAFIDDKGRLLTGDMALAVLVKFWPTKGKIIYDVNSTTALREVAEANGFTPIEWKVGRAFILQKVREEGAVLGGEKSNHLYFGDIEGTDDAIYAALTMSRVVYDAGRRLSEIVDEIPHYPTTPILTYDCPDSIKFKAVDRIAEALQQRGFRISRLDGVKAYADDGWLLIRASNTMPQLKMSVEAKTTERLKELKRLGENLIREITSKEAQ